MICRLYCGIIFTKDLLSYLIAGLFLLLAERDVENVSQNNTKR